MSRENLDLVRSICADWERGDFGSVTWADAEIELVVADGPKPVGLRGLRAALEYRRDLLSTWKGHRVAVEEVRELDGERVLVLLHARGGQGAAGHGELARDAGGAVQLFSIRAGRVTRLLTYLDRRRGLTELGLGERAD